MNRIKELDYDLSYKIAKSLRLDSPIRKFFQFATITGTAFFWFIAIPIWYYWFDGGDEAITLGLMTLFMLVPVFAIKQTIRRSRPDFKDTRFGAVMFDEWSFPSGHSTRSTYVVILMGFYMPEFVFLWIIWAAIMIGSRLILGVHYISDILAGITLSCISVSIFYFVGWIPTIPWDVADKLP